MSKHQSSRHLTTAQAAAYLGLKKNTIACYSGPRGCPWGPKIPHVLGPRRGRMGRKIIRLFRRCDLDAWDAQRKAYHATAARKVETSQEANSRLKAEITALKTDLTDQPRLERRIKTLERKIKEALQDAAEQRAEKNRAQASLKLITDYCKRLEADLASAKKAADPAENTELPQVSEADPKIKALVESLESDEARRVAVALVQRRRARNAAPALVLKDLLTVHAEWPEDLPRLYVLSCLTWKALQLRDASDFKDEVATLGDVAARLGWLVTDELSPVKMSSRATRCAQAEAFLKIYPAGQIETTIAAHARNFEEMCAKEDKFR